MFQIPKEGEMSRLVIKTGGHKEVKGILDPPEKFSIAIHTETLKKYYSVPQCADIKGYCVLYYVAIHNNQV